jgi:enoyl-CoA hydratase/carnithine racemase
MDGLTTVKYEVTGSVARITLNRPHRGNAITLEMPRELARCVEQANLDPAVHVLLLSGAGEGFCAGYDLVDFAHHAGDVSPSSWPAGSPLDSNVVAANHEPSVPWDPILDYMMMSRNARGFMSLFHAEKPVVCKVHGYCVAGGTDMALCSDLLVIEDKAKIGYPPSRVWGSPTTALWAYRIGIEKAKRLLFTGDSLSGSEALAWGLATEAPSRDELDGRTEALVERIARLPVSQLAIMKLLLNQTILSQGLAGVQTLGTVFDGIARHTPEGHAFAQRVREVGPKQAARERDEPFGDPGRSTFKG